MRYVCQEIGFLDHFFGDIDSSAKAITALIENWYKTYTIAVKSNSKKFVVRLSASEVFPSALKQLTRSASKSDRGSAGTSQWETRRKTSSQNLMPAFSNMLTPTLLSSTRTNVPCIPVNRGTSTFIGSDQ